MSSHVLERSQLLPLSADAAFDFFADAHNLEAITPPFLRFRIVTPGPIEMREGALIEYRLRMHRVPVSWRTEITTWEPGRRFVDEQIAGPFAEWHHTHSFEPDGDGRTLMRDQVRYRLPLGLLGEIARVGLVDRDLARIFDYRREELERRLNSQAARPRSGAGPRR